MNGSSASDSAGNPASFQESDPDKEKKRQKALRRMGKVLGKAWELPDAHHFHQSKPAKNAASTNVMSLSTIGERLDQQLYRYGRHGWEDFAQDIGSVYHRHIHRRTKHAIQAKEHLEQVSAWLGEKDPSLAQAAKRYTPKSNNNSNGKKRKNEEIESRHRPEKASTMISSSGGNSNDIQLSEREERALGNLANYIKDHGGKAKLVQDFTCRVTRKPSDGRYDTNYYNGNGKRFRSMVEVGKFFNLVATSSTPARSAGGKKAAGMNKRKKMASTTTAIENEKKKLRKELEKLRRQHTKARKQLDDFLTDDKDSRYPIEDCFLQTEQEKANVSSDVQNGSTTMVLPTNCPVARLPDIESFPGLPQHCMPEVLAVWDFLSTFTRSLNLAPVALDDFIQCLTYKPPANLSDGDIFKYPPVFLGEAHLGLLKLILGDPSSDEWWWSILETDITENAVTSTVDVDESAEEIDESDLPLIKVDFAALLLETEDPLITQSWLQHLESIKSIKTTEDSAGIRNCIRNAMGIAANKYIVAYLRKSLKLGETSGPSFMKQSIFWLIEKFREARPDLSSRSVNTKLVLEKRAKVVDEVSQKMAKLSSAVLAVSDHDLASDIEDESDDESDDSDDEGEKEGTEDITANREDPDEKPASYIPKKPLPALVDLLLPPNKPAPTTDLLNASSWPQMAGATSSRIIHRYKRLRNELDDSLRLIRELPRLTVRQRRERELIASKRVFSEFVEGPNGEDSPQKASDHLCSGGDYLDLSPTERLALLRVLIDAAYDTGRVHEIVDSNHKQRTNAVKSLNAEQRRASKEAKEKAAAAEAAAREDLALEAKRNFIEDKREEIRKINEANEELTQEEIDDLTEEDILDFDDDIRADFEALPAPESFKKAEVIERVEQIKENAAFETDMLTVLTMSELMEREETELHDLRQTLTELGGEEALLNSSLDRSVVRRIEKARRDVQKAEANKESLPIQRETALETLKEAISDGTIKSLRAAIRIARTARLFGPDEYTNGVWALDLVRDAHIELESAKQLKRVSDAQQDLMTKLARCFTRTEPLGSDRFRNHVWRFENSAQCQVWSEVNPVLSDEGVRLENQAGFLSVVSNSQDVSLGAPDIEDDFKPKDVDSHGYFTKFSRQEYDPSGISTTLTRHLWGCHARESSIRALMKGLDNRGVRENELKKNLKETLEKVTSIENSPNDDIKTSLTENRDNVEADEVATETLKSDGDEDVFRMAKQAALSKISSEGGNVEFIQSINSGISQNVRIRIVIESNRDGEIARYEDSSIVGWKYRQVDVPAESEGDDEFDPTMKSVDVPVWYCQLGNGQDIWLTGQELLDSIFRYIRRQNSDPTYMEADAAFLSYRNSMGRHCGKANEAAQALTPIRFAQFMVRREAELYQRLKYMVYENTWGGREGNRNAWAISMKDFAYDFETAKEGLLTLENALLEMTGGIAENPMDQETISGTEILSNPKTREDIELESIEKGIKGLWNSRASREVFLEIMKSSKTVGFLALGLELLSRNTLMFISTNTTTSKGSTAKAASDLSSYNHMATTVSSSRSSRRSAAAAAWDESMYYDDIPAPRTTRRVARVNYMGLD